MPGFKSDLPARLIATSSKCPAECIFAFIFLNSPSIYKFKVSPILNSPLLFSEYMPICAIASPTIFNSLTLKIIDLSWDYIIPVSAGWPPPYGWKIVASKININYFSMSLLYMSKTLDYDSNL